jgi:hypothetical protein
MASAQNIAKDINPLISSTMGTNRSCSGNLPTARK